MICAIQIMSATPRHFFFFAEHIKNSAIGKHVITAHGRSYLNASLPMILRKCQSKFDCLVFEMLFIKKLKPYLNVQADSILVKLFV